MYQVGIKNTFKAGHFLHGDFGEETIPHEHEYVVEWICAANELDENGFSVDIAVMEEELQELVVQIQGTSLNDLEFFKNRQVSVENLARYILVNLTAALKQRRFPVSSIRESQIKIWESETAWAAYLQQ